MVSIILAIDAMRREVALKAGFKEETILIRHESGMSTKSNKEKIESDIMGKIKPYQFLVSDFWGLGPG